MPSSFTINICVIERNSKFENTWRNSNCNSNVQTFEISENLWMLNETPHQTSPTWKIHTFAWKHVGWNFVLEQTSSNIFQKDLFLLFLNFTNFVIAQTIPTFYPKWQKRDVGWNVGLVCSGFNIVLLLKKKIWMNKLVLFSFPRSDIICTSRRLVFVRLSFPCIYFRGCWNSRIFRRLTFALAEEGLSMANVIWTKEYQIFVKLPKVKSIIIIRRYPTFYLLKAS